MSLPYEMKNSTVIAFGLALIAIGIVATSFMKLRPNRQSEQNLRTEAIRARTSKKSITAYTESILRKKIRSSDLKFKNLRDKMDFIEEMICDDTYPTNVTDAIAKLDSDLDFLLSLEYSYQRTSCIHRVSRNYVRDSMNSAKNPEDFLDRMAMYDETIRKSGTNVDYEELMQTVSGEAKERILQSGADSSDQYKRQMAGMLSTNGGPGEIASRIYGGILADGIEQEPSTSVAALLNIKDPSLRLGTEKSLLRSDTIDFVAKQSLAAYYLSSECKLPHDVAVEKNLFGLGIKYDPETISTMIASAPPSIKRDYAIAHLVFRSAAEDFERARLWWEIIQDPEVKARAEKFLQKNR